MKLDEKTLRNSQRLRKEMTKEERHLWYDFLRSYPVQFKRQFPIDNYIVDFYCHQAKLVVELDGSQHYEPEKLEYDRRRTAFLEEKGLYVLRFSNLDVMRGISRCLSSCRSGCSGKIALIGRYRHPSSVTASPCHLPPGGRLWRRYQFSQRGPVVFSASAGS